MTSGIDKLLHKLCVTYGYCGCVKFDKPLHVDDFIPPKGPVHAEQFVEWVFLADDVNPNSDDDHIVEMKSVFRSLFVEYLGAETVDALVLLSRGKRGEKRWLSQ
ncbi:MAG: hypothetical protein AAGL10_13130 [Pseudomonadota bacterium]